MTNVLVCVKRVPELTTEVLLTEDRLRVDARNVGYTTSAHEECAVELAIQVASATGGTATVLTVGGGDAVEQLRNALSGGADGAILIEADADAFGPADVARAVADVVRSSDTAYDLILVGNDAADTGDFQVGVRLGYALDRPVVAGATSVTVDGETVSIVAEGPDGTAVYEVRLPAVATILEGGVTPRYPSLVGRMKAKKISIDTVHPAFEPTRSSRLRLHTPPPVPSEVQLLGEGPAAAAAVVDTLRTLGVLRR